MKYFFLLFTLSCFCSFPAFTQTSSWEKIEWFSQENPLRQIRPTKNNGKVEVKGPLTYLNFFSDSFQLPLPAGGGSIGQFIFTSSNKIYLQNFDGLYQLNGKKYVQVSSVENFLNAYPFGSQVFFCSTKNSSLYREDSSRNKKFYQLKDNIPFNAFSEKRFFSDDSTYLILSTKADGKNTSFYLYHDELDSWDYVGSLGEIRSIFVHPKTKTFYALSGDTILSVLPGKTILKRSAKAADGSLPISNFSFDNYSNTSWLLYPNALVKTDNAKDWLTINLFEATNENATVMQFAQANTDHSYPRTFKSDNYTIVSYDTLFSSGDSVRAFVFLSKGDKLIYQFKYWRYSDPRRLETFGYLEEKVLRFSVNNDQREVEIFNGQKFSKAIPLPPGYVNQMSYKDGFLFLNSDSGLYKLEFGADLIVGKVFLDLNANGKKDENEVPYSGEPLMISPGDCKITPDENGRFLFKPASGEQYSVSSTTSQLSISTVTSLSEKWLNEIGLKVENKSLPRVRLNLELGKRRCGEINKSGLQIINSGLSPIKKINVKISVESPLNISDDETGMFSSELTVVQSSLPISQKVTVPFFTKWPDASFLNKKFVVKIIADIFDGSDMLVHQEDSLLIDLKCSYDPNEKEVWELNQATYQGIPVTNELLYKISFQNTGTDTAYNVTISDTLDDHLDVSSFKFLNSSHPVSTEVSGNQVKFIFDSIMLPDSSVNRVESQGYVYYKVTVPQTFKRETIKNTAYIYFDQNDPVRTNTTVTGTFNSNAQLENITSIKENDFYIYPNPSSGEFFISNEKNYAWEIMNLQGQICLKGNSKIAAAFQLPKGMYFILIFKNVTETKKLEIR